MTPSAAQWGVRPILFTLGNARVPSYGVFVALGLALGLLVYGYEAARNRQMGENTLWILLAAVGGGALGAKLPVLLLHAGEIRAAFPDLSLLLSGRSIVGGLAGGACGVFLVKRWLGISERKGNLFAPAVAAGVSLGRIGCFLRGCCFGTETALPWGVDFGDGVLRHPTQIYESLFMLAMYIVLNILKSRIRHPAALLWLLMTGYFSFRFAIEFIRVEPRLWMGLSFFQWISGGLVIAYAARWASLFRRGRGRREDG